MTRIILSLMYIGIAIFSHSTIRSYAQPDNRLKCGAIIEAETNTNERVHKYIIDEPAGTLLRGYVEPLASTFNVAVQYYDGGGLQIGLQLNENVQGVSEIIDNSNFILPSMNSSIAIAGVSPLNTDSFANNWGGPVGAYTLYLGCVTREGITIEPGSNSSSMESNETLAPIFSGVGFPGLLPKDFTDAVLIPFNSSAPNIGSISPFFDSVFGYQFEANAGDIFELDFMRQSGNLNLALAVISSNNEILFQASLVTSDALSTRFTFPSSGQYTIGVYKIDLLPPGSPETTTFQIAGTLNP